MTYNKDLVSATNTGQKGEHMPLEQNSFGLQMEEFGQLISRLTIRRHLNEDGAIFMQTVSEVNEVLERLAEIGYRWITGYDILDNHGTIYDMISTVQREPVFVSISRNELTNGGLYWGRKSKPVEGFTDYKYEYYYGTGNIVQKNAKKRFTY
jgi:hypothetical protein